MERVQIYSCKERKQGVGGHRGGRPAAPLLLDHTKAQNNGAVDRQSHAAAGRLAICGTPAGRKASRLT